jgi:eukaryotic-like serine/threonine-protein kinase
MSQGVVLCPYCGRHHDVHEQMCPWTGKPLRTAPVPPAKPELDMALFPLVGETLGGKYLVRSALGKGGMGTVYEGVNIQIGRVVALKVLHAKQLKKKEAVKRFYQEARTAGAIGHPNICEVYDLGTLENGCPYLVMERLVGVTLADRIAKERTLPIPDVLDALTQVLSGLVAAHAKGIIHRDIKPENVFLTLREGYPPVAKLLDFGVSKILPISEGTRDSDLDLTRAGMVMGTPFYMSPEQARGDRDLDARLDIYGCGVLLYEALTGKRPFDAKSYNVLLWQILTKPPKPARELRPEIPSAVARVIEIAMSRNRDDRFPSATAFIQALAKARNEPFRSEPPRVPPPPETQRMAFDSGSLHEEVPISVELSPESAASQSSAEVAAFFGARPVEAGSSRLPPPPPRKTGFEDIPTEIQGVKDFLLSDEVEAATKAMQDDELAVMARKAAQSSSKPHAREEPIPPPKETQRMLPTSPSPADIFTGDETVKMDNPIPKLRRPVPKPRR